jgi:hypothetical protein
MRVKKDQPSLFSAWIGAADFAFFGSRRWFSPAVMEGFY